MIFILFSKQPFLRVQTFRDLSSVFSLLFGHQTTRCISFIPSLFSMVHLSPYFVPFVPSFYTRPLQTVLALRSDILMMFSPLRELRDVCPCYYCSSVSVFSQLCPPLLRSFSSVWVDSLIFRRPLYKTSLGDVNSSVAFATFEHASIVVFALLFIPFVVIVIIVISIGLLIRVVVVVSVTFRCVRGSEELYIRLLCLWVSPPTTVPTQRILPLYEWVFELYSRRIFRERGNFDTAQFASIFISQKFRLRTSILLLFLAFFHSVNRPPISCDKMKLSK
jgi:hypothetical protein